MIITRGYLISKKDYDLFDEIIIFLNEHGLFFKCFCQGTRKISSKNGRNLNYGDFLEFEFFYSKNKLSRLKKVNTISHINEIYKDKWSLILINEIYSKLNISNKKIFVFYQKILMLILENFNDYLVMMLICLKITKFLNLPINITDPNKNNFFLFIDYSKNGNKSKRKTTNLDEIIEIVSKIYRTDDISNINLNNININDIKYVVKKLIFYLNDKTDLFIETLKWI